jgi:hypothetical protein
VSRRAPCREITLECRRGFVAERHHPHLAALAAHQQLAARRMHVVAADVDQLLAAQSTPVEQLEHESVTQGQWIGAPHGVADRVDLGRSQSVRQAPPTARAGQVLRRVDVQHVAFRKKPAERTHGRQFASQCGGRVAASPQVGHESPHRRAIELGEPAPAFGQPLVELREIGGVRPPRGRRQPAHLEGAQELLDQVIGAARPGDCRHTVREGRLVFSWQT